MTVAVVALAFAVVALVGALIASEVRKARRDDAYSERGDQLAKKTVEAERNAFELAAERKARIASDARNAALEAYVAEIEESPNADLDASDVASRIRRVLLHAQADAAGGTGDPVRADGEPAVRDDQPAEVVRAAGPDDLLRPE